MAETVPVYDISVPELQNFKLASGIFVHNSKDVADALAGVVYGLTMRREIWGIHGVSPVNLPDTMKKAMDKSQEKVTEKK